MIPPKRAWESPDSTFLPKHATLSVSDPQKAWNLQGLCRVFAGAQRSAEKVEIMGFMGISRNSCKIVNFADFHVNSMISGEIRASGPAGRPG